MALTQAAERAALNKLIDYLDEDPKANIDKIMALVDRLVPESVLTSQRRAFDTAIRERNNWYRLMMRIFDLNPAVRTKLLKVLIADCSILGWPMQEKMREKYQCKHTLRHPARPHERLQPPLHGLLGLRVRPCPQPLP